MSWYGLFVGKFPFQVLCCALGLCAILGAGLHRIKVTDVKPEDYLPTDSRSNKERVTTLMFDYEDKENPSVKPSVLYPQRPKMLSSMFIIQISL